MIQEINVTEMHTMHLQNAESDYQRSKKTLIRNHTKFYHLVNHWMPKELNNHKMYEPNKKRKKKSYFSLDGWIK